MSTLTRKLQIIPVGDIDLKISGFRNVGQGGGTIKVGFMNNRDANGTASNMSILLKNLWESCFSASIRRFFASKYAAMLSSA